MKKTIISIVLGMLFTIPSMAQLNLNGHFYGQDVLKFSQYSNYGSARSMAMGSAFTALGGDASNTYLNPAGLAFYNKSEVSFNLNFRDQNAASTYLDSYSNFSSSKVGIGQASGIFSKKGKASGAKRTTIGISYNTLVNFHNEYTYGGSNNRSSMMDYFAEQANFRGATPETLNDEFNSSTGTSDTPTSMYYQAYMIDSYNDNYVVMEPSLPVVQSGRVSEKGNVGQVNFSYAANFDDNAYFGGSIGFQTLKYNSLNSHFEDFPGGEVMYGYGYTDELIVSGFGINLSLGGIYKLSKNVRIGATLTTPTWMNVFETFYSSIQIDPNPEEIVTDWDFVKTVPSDFEYNLNSPLRGSFGTSFILPKSMGVLSFEAEYVGYGLMRVKDKFDYSWSDEQNLGIQNLYKDVVNLKGGAEIRFNNLRLRGGVNYMPDPYRKNDELDRSKMELTGGAGYRTAKFFIDAAYTSHSYQSSYTPYALTTEENYSSVINNNKVGVFSMTLGMFF